MRCRKRWGGLKEYIYGHAKRLQWILSRTRKEDLILEFGCGTGSMISIPLAPLGYTVVGLDIDPKSIAFGQELCRAAGVDREIHREGPISRFDGLADVVIAAEVFEHIPEEDLPGVLSGIREKLKEGGALLVAAVSLLPHEVAMAVGAIGVQFGNLGLHASNTYYVARERSFPPALIGNTLLVSFAVGGYGSVMAWIVFSLRPNLAPVHGLLLALALLWIPFGLAYLLLPNLLLGISEVRAYNKIELNNQFITVVLTGFIILGGIVSVETVFVAGFIALVASFSLALLGLKKHAKDYRLPSLSLFRDNIRYGIKAYLAAFFSFLVLRIDLLMVKYMLGAEQTGYYSIAVTMADLINMLPVVVATILFPKICAIESVAEKWLMTKKVTVVTGVILVGFCGLAVFLAQLLVRVLYGKSFLPSVPAFVWLMPGIFFLGVQVIAVQFLNSVGFPKTVVAIWGCCAFLNVIANLWAIPEYRIVGASFVSSISYFMVFISVVFIIRKNISMYAA